MGPERRTARGDVRSEGVSEGYIGADDGDRGSAVVIVMTRPLESGRSHPGMSHVNRGFTRVDLTAMRTPRSPATASEG